MSTITTKFVDEQGLEIKSLENMDVKLMDSYKVEAPLIDGYTLVGNKDVTGTIETDNLEVAFTYKKNEKSTWNTKSI